MSLNSSFIPSSSDVERYQRLRRLARDLHHRILKTIPRMAFSEIGEAIGTLRRGVLVFNSEDETHIQMDCCLYDWIQNGKNLVEKYAENHPPAPGTDEDELLRACLQAQYRILIPLSTVQGAGAYCVDPLSAEEVFIMDIGLSYNPLGVAYATRTIPLGQFWMTGGAALPAGRTTIEDAIDGLKKQRLLEDGKFTDQHKAALILVRRLLEDGASQHIAYEDMEDHRKTRFRKADGAAAWEQRVSAYTPGRNSPCPCGSRKRYKRCCGAKA
jgi:hypothetical protein